MQTHSIAVCSLAVLGVACGDMAFNEDAAVMQTVERAKFGLEGPAADPNVSDPNAVITDPNSLPRCDDLTAWSSEAAAQEAEFLTLLNEFRAQGATCGDQNMPPAPPVTHDEALGCAARWHAWDMAERAYFAHDAPDGTHASDRIQAAGYTWKTWGENIAMGRATAKDTLTQWAKSPPHCMNMMEPYFTQIGIGYYAKPEPQAWRGRMWVLDLGTPRAHHHAKR